MARTPDPELHALWRHRLCCQADSGLTIVQYCARERFSVGSFHAWKRRLRLGDLADQRPALLVASAFLPVTLCVAEHALGEREPLPIVADLPNGIQLRIPTANTRLACRLIRAVAGAKTDSGGSQ
jgi:hypothetical protein